MSEEYRLHAGLPEDEFEKWLSQTTDSFARLPADQQELTIAELIEGPNNTRMSDGGLGSGQKSVDAREPDHMMLQSLSTVFHKDMLSSLPPELNELICSMVDGKSLLKACSVSRNWNRIISSLQKVWQAKCVMHDFQGIAGNDWKMKYVEGCRMLNDMSTGRSFVQETLEFNTTRNTVSISDSYLYASTFCSVSIWKITTPLNKQPVAQFDVRAPVKTLCEHYPHVLVCGHLTGEVSVWYWETDGSAEEMSWFVADGMTVTCLGVNERLGLVSSGGWDGIARMWCLCGRHVQSHTAGLVEPPVLQVAILSHQVRSPRTEEFSLVSVSKTAVLISRYVTKESTKRSETCDYCFMNVNLEFIKVTKRVCVLGSEVTKHPTCHMCHFIQGKIVYIKRKGKNIFHVMNYDLDDGKEVEVIRLKEACGILAAGKVFLLLLSENMISHYYFTLMNIAKNTISATWKFPRGTHSLLGVTSGFKLWLDDLGTLAEEIMPCMFAHFSQPGHIHVTFWQPRP